jgi:hypothetical protein
MFTPPDVELLIEPEPPPLRDAVFRLAFGAFFLRELLIERLGVAAGPSTAFGACGGAGGGGGGAGAAASSGTLLFASLSTTCRTGDFGLLIEHIIFNPHYL